MHDMKEFEDRRIAAQAVHKAKSKAKSAAQEKVRDTRGIANRAEGRRLPEAEQARLEANAAQFVLIQATKEQKNATFAVQTAIKDENSARRENAEESKQQEKLDAYDVRIGYDETEFLGIAYDGGTVYFDFVEDGITEQGITTTSLYDIEKMIEALTAISKKMA